MKSYRKTAYSALAVLGGLAMAATAQADIVIGDTLSLTFVDVDPGRSVDWELSYGGDDGLGDSGSSRAGIFNWVGGVKTFCVQIEENISGGQMVNYNVVSPADVPDGGVGNDPVNPGAMGALKSLQMQTAFSLWYDTLGSDKDLAAAFQVVIWEISHELDPAPYSISTGDAMFTSGSAVETMATDWLAEINGRTSADALIADSRVLGLTNLDYQDQLVMVPGVGSLAALMGVAAVGRRRRRG